MEDFLGILEDHYPGVLMLLLLLFAAMFFFTWLMRAFGWGRFGVELELAQNRAGSSPLGNVWIDFLHKIITEFRHLLALLVVSIFAVALGYALWVAGDDTDDLSKSLQAVTSTLGGLVGSIIGYYFGESKAIERNERQGSKAAPQGADLEQTLPGKKPGTVPPPTTAPPPPPAVGNP